MDYQCIPLTQPRGVRLLSYDGLHSDGDTPKFSLKPTSYKIEPIIARDGTLAQVQERNIQKPRFHAISYARGDPTELKSIYCNDTYVEVTKVLHDALTQLSAQFPERFFWVDALCINLSDLAEKEMQVAMMGDIYRTAESVMIWLGRADGLSSIPFQSTIENYIQIRSKVPLKDNYPACQKCKWTLFEQVSCPNEQHLEIAPKCPGLRELTGKMGESEWFHRIWTFQELKLAMVATVHLGPFFMPWEFFAPAFEEFNRSHGCVMKPLSRIYQLNRSIQTPLGTERFAELIEATRDRQTTIPQDRIFGLMGIPTKVKFPLKIDYSIPLEQLYMAVIRFCVNEDNTLGILDSIGDNGRPGKLTGMSNLPSWIIDFSTANLFHAGDTNMEFGQLPSLSSSESSLNMYCFVLGYYMPDDERYKSFHNSRAPDFRSLPPCVIRQITSDTKLVPSRIAVSRPFWINYGVGYVDNTAQLYDRFTESSDLLSYLGNHLRGECSCSQTNSLFQLFAPGKTETVPKSVEDEPAELACILVNQNGHAASTCLAVQPIGTGKFKLAGRVNWPVLWPLGFDWVPGWKKWFRGKTLYDYSMAFTSVDLY